MTTPYALWIMCVTALGPLREHTHALAHSNKAGGLIFSRSYTSDLPSQTANELLIAAGTFHGIDAIASRISPVGSSSGVQVVESDAFKMTCLRTPTGARLISFISSLRRRTRAGLKFVLLTSPSHANADAILQRAYVAYSAYLQNPFYTTDMPLRGVFDERMALAIRG